MKKDQAIKKVQKGDEKFNPILEKENRWLKKRREGAKVAPGEPGEDSVGLGLSGGGIRSATFNLGLLQAMERNRFLENVDYLSTVSGGGYIGSCLTWFMFKQKKFPFGTCREDHKGLGGAVLAHLLSYGKYLTPGEGLNIWALLGAFISGTLVNLLILVPLFLFAFWFLSLESGIFVPYVPGAAGIKVITWLLLLGIFLLAVFLLGTILSTLTTRFKTFRKWNWQGWMRKWNGELLKYGVLLLAVGTIPIVYDWLSANLRGWIETAMSGVSISGIISMFSAGRGRKDGNETRGARSFFLSIGLALMVYGLFLWFYYLANNRLPLVYILGGVLISIIMILFTDSNHVCMHRFYRNRLMQAYMPETINLVEEGQGKTLDIGDSDKFYLGMIKQSEKNPTRTPYHIVNTNLQTVGSGDTKLRGRGGDNFIFSPHYSGSDSTDYVETDRYVGGKMNLPTAYAISGAAVDPNTFSTRSRPLSFIMTLLNIRLGYWIVNPKSKKAFKTSKMTPRRYGYLFAEMFGKGLNEKQKYVHLSDGGHFENLGLYELIRRHCRYIIISDAGQDKDWKFGSLGKLIEMARLDFGAKIELDTRPLIPREKDKRSPGPFIHGKITYNNGDTGDIIYIKTTMVDNLPEDIYCYRRDNPDFPDQSTMDQFFDERQFEAYRELGYRIGERLFGHFKGDVAPFFSTVKPGFGLTLPVAAIDGIGDKYAKLLNKQDIHTLGDLVDIDPLQPIGNIPPVKLREFRAKARAVTHIQVDLAPFIPLADWNISDILKTEPGKLAEMIDSPGVTPQKVTRFQEKLAGLQVALDDEQLKSIPLKEL